MKVGLIFGGMSNEKEVSIKSCRCIFENIDKEKYNVSLIFIDEVGEYYQVEDCDLNNKEKIDNVFVFLKTFDVIFPVLHGKFGEDGTIQGMLEMLNVKYVGCNVLSSSICMDKLYAKYILEKAGFNQAKYEVIKYINDEIIYITKDMNEEKVSIAFLENLLSNNLLYPMYVKPANSGSSVGMSKINCKDELEKAIKLASVTDQKIIFEEEIIGQELECAILENDDLLLGDIGEVLTGDFYDYDKKYNNDFCNTLVPANISASVESEVKKLAIKAFKAVGASGISRVDFFLKDGKIYINEINTLPGFTSISMYPKLLESKNLSIKNIIDILITKAS